MTTGFERDREFLRAHGWTETKGGWKKKEVFKDIPISREQAIEVQHQLDISELQGGLL